MITSKLGFCVLLSFSVLSAHGQNADDPFANAPTEVGEKEPFDAFAEADRQEREAAERGVPRITLLTEFIQLPHRDWSELSRVEALSGDDSALRREVAKKLNSGHATLLDMSLVSTVSGYDFVTDSFEFHIYPAAFDPPEIDERNGRIVPASYAASECRNCGFRAYGKSTLAADFSSVDLNIAPEYVGLSGENKAGKGNGEVTNPKFVLQRVSSSLDVPPGEFALAGVFQAAQPDESEDVVLVFLRPTVQVVRIDSAETN